MEKDENLGKLCHPVCLIILEVERSKQANLIECFKIIEV